ncbi:flagellar basal body rod protein FlgC [Sphingomonas sp. RS6]
MIAANVAYTGLQASVARLNVSAQNLANANTTGETVKAVPAVAAAGRVENSAYRPVALYQAAAAAGGVTSRVVTSDPGTVQRYDPDSADADEDGMIEAPDVDEGAEAGEQVKALSAYRANLSVIRADDQMQGTLLDMVA